MVEANSINITSAFILSHITQEQIFERYLGIPVTLTEWFSNPLRIDINPSCTFKWFGKWLYLRDWSTSNTTNCFELVKQIYFCNYSEALQLIAFHFQLLDKEITFAIRYVIEPKKQLIVAKIKSKNEIRVNRKEWNEKGLQYWQNYHLDLEDLQDTAQLSCYWYNKIQHNPTDISFVYHNKEYEYKLYFPKADKSKGEIKFLHTDASIIWGEKDLKFNKSTLIITSSNKDKKVLRKINRLFDLDIEVVNSSSETTLIPIEKINFYKSKYKVVLLYLNNDKAGISESKKQSQLYQVNYIINPQNQPKDISDFVKENGLESGYDLINYLIYE